MMLLSCLCSGKRSVTLGDTVKLMGVVQSVVDIPQRVQKLEEAKVIHAYPKLNLCPKLLSSVMMMMLQRCLQHPLCLYAVNHTQCVS